MKLISLDNLAKRTREASGEGKSVIYCHGVFDLLHIGHIRYLEQARKMGDILVVTLTPDRYVDKGPHRPAFNESLRAEALASLDCIDYVAVNKWPTAEESLRLLRPHVYVKGSEFKEVSDDRTGKMARELAVVDEIGARLAFTDDIVFSSSNLINRYFNNLPREQHEYLQLFRKRYSLDRILSQLDKMNRLNVLVVGDTILDEYLYCDAIGKSSKDPVLAVKYQSRDLFAGGVLAVANHVGAFTDKVDLLTVIGDQDPHEEFIRANLSPSVTPRF
ncbi:MAG: adenylyltransferase/cytidyltransferase family protein, partial [Desulfobacterales bacterium]|nr:adenylyltransferase/cytidyltransferase family protein [Desulfobacterales bacterium]